MKIIVSSCLMGKFVRYNGTTYWSNHPILDVFKKKVEIIDFCPEVEGGLPIPRKAAEISGGDGFDVLLTKAQVLTNTQTNITKNFIVGVRKLKTICEKHNIGFAIFKEGSPACGVNRIYNGTFTNTSRAGSGVAAALLRKLEIPLFSEKEIEGAYLYWLDLEKRGSL